MDKIKCPNCGYEYLPVEIFIPSSVFGKYVTIERDEEGHIQDEDSIIFDMDKKETYTCDKCNRNFTVRIDMNFSTESSSTGFKEEYSIKVNKPKLFMNESV